MACMDGGAAAWEYSKEVARLRAMLCAVCRRLTPDQIGAIEGLREWWDHHRREDARRVHLQVTTFATEAVSNMLDRDLRVALRGRNDTMDEAFSGPPPKWMDARLFNEAKGVYAEARAKAVGDLDEYEADLLARPQPTESR